MWYTPVSGIWQTVWIESVYDDYVENLTITPDIDNSEVNIIVNSNSKNITLKIYQQDKVIYKEKQTNGIFKVKIDNPTLWTPENPFLYKLEISTKNDEIKSYLSSSMLSNVPSVECFNVKLLFNKFEVIVFANSGE